MRLDRRQPLLIGLLFGALLVLAACAPEANRERGGDTGGDIGNWGQVIEMHGDDDAFYRIYYGTPAMGRGIERSGSAGAVAPES